MDFKINWLEPWDELVTTDTSFFENELYKEVGKHHILYGKKVTAIGKRYDRDDVLFTVDNSEFEFSVVHLTYSKTTEDNSNYPKTKTYKDLNDWIDRCMMPENSMY